MTITDERQDPTDAAPPARVTDAEVEAFTAAYVVLLPPGSHVLYEHVRPALEAALAARE